MSNAAPEIAAPAGPDELPPPNELERLEIELLLEAIYRHYGFDFRAYAYSSLTRRIRKCAEAEQRATVSGLQELVLHDPQAMQRLVRTLCVNVTAMFRDPSFFLVFRQRVVPLLRTYPFVRIWHAGCSTGEEVYAMCILLKEEGMLHRTRIYATDVETSVIEEAKRGIFPLARMQEYTTNYIKSGGKYSFSQYYTAKYDGALFDPELAQSVLFTQHNLATDRSFSEFHVILCRNVLIYFNRALKDRVLNLFSESMSPLGVLCLGRKESLRFTAAETEYATLDTRERIYRRLT